jgi:hypothetical protein
MCVYCFIADWMRDYTTPKPLPDTMPITIPVQPWSPWTPAPTPLPGPAPWTQEQYDQAIEILRKVKEMEERLGGCPCEDASKMDFLKEIAERLARIERKIDGSESETPSVSE